MGWTALVAVLATVALGTGASAESFPIYRDVKVSPATVSTPDQEVVVSGPGFPGQQGCVIGRILALVPGAPLAEARVLLGPVNLDVPVWSYTRTSASDGPIPAGTYDLLLSCIDDAANSQIRSTEAVLTVTSSATTTTTSTTAPPPTTATTVAPPTTGRATGTGASVEPTTAKPGFTTLTIRGGGFKPSAPLQISIRGTKVMQLGTTAATATGEYAVTLVLPTATSPGAQQLVVSGLGPDGVSRSTSVDLTVGDLNCSDFATPEAAQAGLGTDGSDPHKLDPERDGAACKRVPGRRAAGGKPALATTGTGRGTIGVVAGLMALTLGSFFMGFSHPRVPGAGLHRRGRPRR